MMSSSSQSTIGLAQRKFLAQLRRIPNIFLPLPLHSASHLKLCECIGVCVDSVHQLLSGFVERLNILPHYGVQVEKLNTAVGHPSHHAPQTRPHGGAQRARATPSRRTGPSPENVDEFLHGHTHEWWVHLLAFPVNDPLVWIEPAHAIQSQPIYRQRNHLTLVHNEQILHQELLSRAKVVLRERCPKTMMMVEESELNSQKKSIKLVKAKKDTFLGANLANKNNLKSDSRNPFFFTLALFRFLIHQARKLNSPRQLHTRSPPSPYRISQYRGCTLEAPNQPAHFRPQRDSLKWRHSYTTRIQCVYSPW